VTFFAVIREGLECVVFLAGMTGSYPAESIPIAAIMGIIVGGVVGYMFYRSGSNLGLKWFAVVSMSMLFMVAAGLVARSFTEWVELGANGGPYVWDARWCCATENPFWGFLRVIFGYNDHPTVLEFMIYWAYWALLLASCWYFKVFNTFEKLPEETTLSMIADSQKTVADDPIPEPSQKAEVINV
jgi:high-affinity iron transporter